MNTENFDLLPSIIDGLADHGYSVDEFMEFVDKAQNHCGTDVTAQVVFEVLAEVHYSFDDAWRIIEEYEGSAEDFGTFCYDLFNDCMECPENLKSYIDYDKWEDACSYDYLVIEAHDKVYCFRNV